VSVKKIVVLATGGTIAGTAARPGDTIGYSAAQLGVGELLSAVPNPGEHTLHAEQVAQIDSKDMTFDIWRELARRCQHWLAQSDVQGIVITHGTDTLEETAFFLHCVLDTQRPVVLTCAMRPATAIGADGPQNLSDAICTAGNCDARGVVAVCAGTIHGARDVAKQHTYRLDAFTSGDAGPIGYVENGSIRQVRQWPAPPLGANELLGKFLSSSRLPEVEIVVSYADGGRKVVDALVKQGVDGLVVAGTGNGSVHSDLEAGLLDAQTRGVRVLRATRCSQGRVIARDEDVLPDAGDLSPVKARIALMLQLLG
jgi:L-asparaginase